MSGYEELEGWTLVVWRARGGRGGGESEEEEFVRLLACVATFVVLPWARVKPIRIRNFGK